MKKEIRPRKMYYVFETLLTEALELLNRVF